MILSIDVFVNVMLGNTEDGRWFPSADYKSKHLYNYKNGAHTIIRVDAMHLTSSNEMWNSCNQLTQCDSDVDLDHSS